MARAALLLCALALLGCPGEQTGIEKGKVGARLAETDTTDLGRQQTETPEAPSSGSSSPEASGALVAVESEATVRDPRDGFLFLRIGPSSSTDALAQMPNGSAVYVEACEPGTLGRRWCRLRFGAQSGWASETGLDYPAPAPEADARTATVTDPDGWTNLRSEPSTSAAVTTRLLAGASVTVRACIPPQGGSRSRWCEVDAFTVTDGDLRGWIAESRLRYD